MKNSTLYGHYGAFKSQPHSLYQAIGIARILMFRGMPTPRGFDTLLGRVKEWPDGDYARRRQVLGYFGIKTYQAYLDSELWKAVRALALAEHDGMCRFCDNRANQVHHRSYDIATLVGAKIDRLYPSCRDCHRRIEFDTDDRKRTFPEVVEATLNAAR